MRGRVAAVVVLAGALVFGARRDAARACTVADPARFIADNEEALVDSTPPPAPRVLSVEVHRGRSAGGCGGTSSSSCDDIGWVSLKLSVEDDRARPEDMGVVVREVRGLPVTAPAGAVRLQGSAVSLYWIDGANADQETIDGTLVVAAVDRAGNVGPTVDVRVVDPPP